MFSLSLSLFPHPRRGALWIHTPGEGLCGSAPRRGLCTMCDPARATHRAQSTPRRGLCGKGVPRRGLYTRAPRRGLCTHRPMRLPWAGVFWQPQNTGHGVLRDRAVAGYAAGSEDNTHRRTFPLGSSVWRRLSRSGIVAAVCFPWALAVGQSIGAFPRCSQAVCGNQRGRRTWEG